MISRRNLSMSMFDSAQGIRDLFCHSWQKAQDLVKTVTSFREDHFQVYLKFVPWSNRLCRFWYLFERWIEELRLLVYLEGYALCRQPHSRDEGCGMVGVPCWPGWLAELIEFWVRRSFVDC